MTLSELTSKITGKKEASLVLLGARPTMGKSSVAMGMALCMAQQGKKVSFITCTEKKPFMKQHLEFINRGELPEEVKANLKISEPAEHTVADIKAFCDNQPDAVFIDALQQLSKGEGSLAELQKALKDMAAELGCPVIVLSQLTDKIDKRLNHKPRVKDLADSGIDAELYNEVMLFYRKSKYKLKASAAECLMVFKDGEESFAWSDVTNCIM